MSKVPGRTSMRRYYTIWHIGLHLTSVQRLTEWPHVIGAWFHSLEFFGGVCGSFHAVLTYKALSWRSWLPWRCKSCMEVRGRPAHLEGGDWRLNLLRSRQEWQIGTKFCDRYQIREDFTNGGRGHSPKHLKFVPSGWPGTSSWATSTVS